jgi:hypothetical protein
MWRLLQNKPPRLGGIFSIFRHILLYFLREKTIGWPASTGKRSKNYILINLCQRGCAKPPDLCRNPSPPFTSIWSFHTAAATSHFPGADSLPPGGWLIKRAAGRLIGCPTGRLDVSTGRLNSTAGWLHCAARRLDRSARRLHRPARRLHRPARRLDGSRRRLHCPTRRLDRNRSLCEKACCCEERRQAGNFHFHSAFISLS